MQRAILIQHFCLSVRPMLILYRKVAHTIKFSLTMVGPHALTTGRSCAKHDLPVHCIYSGSDFYGFWTCRSELTVGQWVVVHGSNGQQVWVDYVSRWPIFLHCTHPLREFVIHGKPETVILTPLIPFTISVTETSRHLWKRTDFLVKAQILLKFLGRNINCCELNLLCA